MASAALLVQTALTHAGSAADKLTARGIGEFTAAYQAWDGLQFAAASATLRQASTNASATATTFYWLGAAEFHRMLQLQSTRGGETSNAAGDEALELAVNALTTAVKLDARHAESHALLGTLFGMKINGNFLRALRYGPRVTKHRNLALEFGPQNPRVQYLLGMCKFHTATKPDDWRATLTTLLHAENLFQAEAKTVSGPLDPRWGHDSCLTFIGRSYELLGQRSQAAGYFRKALGRHPQDHVAQDGLKRVTQSK